jgi:hypothetical protein
MAIKTFTTGEVLTASDTNTYLANSGLVYITSAALTGPTNSFSNVFSSTYDAYRVVITNLNNSTGTTRVMGLRFRTTSDDSSANYFYGLYGFYAATPFNTGSSGSVSADIGSLSSGGNNGGSITLDICNPNLAFTTTYSGFQSAYQSNILAIAMRSLFGGMNTTTQYTGFTVFVSTDNLSGNVTVYGYRKA